MPSRDLLRDVAASLVSEHAPVIIGLSRPRRTVPPSSGALVERLGYPARVVPGPAASPTWSDDRDHPRRGRRGRWPGRRLAPPHALNGRTWLVGRPPGARRGRQPSQGAVVGADLRRRRRGARGAAPRRPQRAVRGAHRALPGLHRDRRPGRPVTFLNRAGRAAGRAHRRGRGPGPSTDDYFTEAVRPKSRGDRGRRCATEGTWEGETQPAALRTGEASRSRRNSFLVTRSSDGTPAGPGHRAARPARRDAARSRRSLLRAQEQRAIAELGRQALTLPLAELMRRGRRAGPRALPGRWSPGCCAAPTTGYDPRWSRPRSAGVARRRPRPRRGLAHRPRPASRTSWSTPTTWSPTPRSRTTTPPTSYGVRSALCCPIPGGDGTRGASSARPAPSPGTGPRTTSPSSSR